MEDEIEFLSPLVNDVLALTSVFVVFVVRPSEGAVDDLRFSTIEDVDIPLLLDEFDLDVSLVELPESDVFALETEAEDKFLSPLVYDVLFLTSVFVVFVVKPSEGAVDDLRFSTIEDGDIPLLLDVFDLVVSLVELPDTDVFALLTEAEDEIKFLSPLVNDVLALPSAFVVFVVKPSEVPLDDF